AVFGSAGGRDAAKRSEMGKIASQYCNVIIFTSEDPRFEDPEQIAKQLASGITNNCTTMTIVDRYEAIRQGIELASANDTVVILGKGDETYMSVRGVSEEWMGDNNAAKEIIQKYFMSEEEDEHED
ncbi:MAG: UDP-N-acetylmuramoyl-L-alanyl-D-glutamate--2,6-diaminopimelate ligase, partial [Erysipelotrichales bacterium]|nr:UDP-N-acetylmuramoyl-L-alanyl-D-glutamate--2,6-diaminopimelate ligase [Erysipelotrichales bacterium]